MTAGGIIRPSDADYGKHPVHALANIFPRLSPAEIDDLGADMAANGQRDEIVLFNGKILDGRNRYAAGVARSLIIRFAIFDGTHRAAVDFVISKNLKRRHMTESQRAMVAARLATLKVGDNQHSAQPKQGVEISTPSLGLGATSPDQMPTPAGAAPVSAAAAGDMLNVDRKSVFNAKKVIEKGADELQNAVDTGTIKVSAAAALADLPIEEQRRIIASADPKAVKDIARKNRADKTAKSRERRLANMALPQSLPLLTGKLYGAHYIDIPREFASWSDAGAERSPDNHYRVEGFDYLAGLRDKLLACSAPNCVVFMWAWANSLLDQIDLLAEWGFASLRRRDESGRLLRGPDGQALPPAGEGRYRSHQIWAKRNADGSLHRGTGYWFIDGHELLLVGARGDVPAPLMGTQARSLLDLPLGEHSAKPNAHFRDQIDGYFPGIPKLEWFGRIDDLAAFKTRHPDWDVTGNMVQAEETQ